MRSQLQSQQSDARARARYYCARNIFRKIRQSDELSRVLFVPFSEQIAEKKRGQKSAQSSSNSSYSDLCVKNKN